MACSALTFTDAVADNLAVLTTKRPGLRVGPAYDTLALLWVKRAEAHLTKGWYFNTEYNVALASVEYGTGDVYVPVLDILSVYEYNFTYYTIRTIPDPDAPSTNIRVLYDQSTGDYVRIDTQVWRITTRVCEMDIPANHMEYINTLVAAEYMSTHEGDSAAVRRLRQNEVDMKRALSAEHINKLRVTAYASPDTLYRVGRMLRTRNYRVT